MYRRMIELEAGDIVVVNPTLTLQVDEILSKGVTVELNTTCLQDQEKVRVSRGAMEMVSVMRRPAQRDPQALLREVRDLSSCIPEG